MLLFPVSRSDRSSPKWHRIAVFPLTNGKMRNPPVVAWIMGAPPAILLHHEQLPVLLEGSRFWQCYQQLNKRRSGKDLEWALSEIFRHVINLHLINVKGLHRDEESFGSWNTLLKNVFKKLLHVITKVYSTKTLLWNLTGVCRKYHINTRYVCMNCKEDIYYNMIKEKPLKCWETFRRLAWIYQTMPKRS